MNAGADDGPQDRPRENSAAGMDAAAPSGLQDFRIEARLGEGSCAVVSRAVHTTLGVPVALKVWHCPVSADQRRKLLAECRLQWTLSDHPHIVRLLWVGSLAGDRPWLAMELYEQSLAQRLGQEPLGMGSALDIAADLLAGLAAVHESGHLHRDVKPANVLLKDGRAALGDLGISMVAEELTRDSAAGTSRYLAPELQRGAQPTYRSDVYSAAVTIGAAVGPDIPAWLDNLLTKATSFNPSDRPGDAAEFRAALVAGRAAAAEGPAHQPGGTTPAPASSGEVTDEHPNRPGARFPRRALLPVAVAALLILLGGAALQWWPLTAAGSPTSLSAQLGPQAQPTSPAATPTPAPTPGDTPFGATPSAPGGSGSPTPTRPSAEAAPTPDLERRPAPAPTRPPRLRPSPAPSVSARIQAEPARPTPVRTRERQLQNVWAGKCMTVYGPFVEDGTSLQLWTCDNVQEERWTLTPAGQLRGLAGKCLDVRGDDEWLGTPVELRRCDGTAGQRWELGNDGELRVFGHMCLDPRGPSRDVGTPLQIWECSGLPQHQWRLIPAA